MGGGETDRCAVISGSPISSTSAPGVSGGQLRPVVIESDPASPSFGSRQRAADGGPAIAASVGRRRSATSIALKREVERISKNVQAVDTQENGYNLIQTLQRRERGVRISAKTSHRQSYGSQSRSMLHIGRGWSKRVVGCLIETVIGYDMQEQDETRDLLVKSIDRGWRRCWPI